MLHISKLIDYKTSVVTVAKEIFTEDGKSLELLQIISCMHLMQKTAYCYAYLEIAWSVCLC